MRKVTIQNSPAGNISREQEQEELTTKDQGQEETHRQTDRNIQAIIKYQNRQRDKLNHQNKDQEFRNTKQMDQHEERTDKTDL